MTGLLCTREFFLLVVCVLCTVNTACRNPNQNKHNQISNKLQTAARTSQTDKRNEIIQMWNGQTAYFNKQGKEKQMWGYLGKKKQRCLISSCPVISTAAPEGRVSWFYYLNRFSPGRNSLSVQKDCCRGPIITMGAPISPRAEEKQSTCDGDRATLCLGGGRETLTDGAARGQRGGRGRRVCPRRFHWAFRLLDGLSLPMNHQPLDALF